MSENKNSSGENKGKEGTASTVKKAAAAQKKTTGNPIANPVISGAGASVQSVEQQMSDFIAKLNKLIEGSMQNKESVNEFQIPEKVKQLIDCYYGEPKAVGSKS